MIRKVVILILFSMICFSVASPTYAGMKKSHTGWSAVKSEYIPYYKEKKSDVGFWVRKGVSLLELYLLLSLSTIIAVLLEVTGVVRFLGVVLGPLVRIGRLNGHSIVAFFSSFRNGSIGNGILRTAYDNNQINKRQLYTSVLIVSSIATLGHLPSYILAIGAVCGKAALLAVTLVRVGAVLVQIVFVSIVSGLVIAPLKGELEIRSIGPTVESPHEVKGGLMGKVIKRSLKTIKRLILYLGIAYLIVSLLEFYGVFDLLFTWMNQYIDLSFLPSEASVIIPAQFVSIHSGLATVANFIADGSISPKVAVTILLIGSMISAPIRTLKRIMPTYVGLLGARSGLILGVSAQLLRMFFLFLSIICMWIIW